jgi:hypothetical protein
LLHAKNVTHDFGIAAHASHGTVMTGKAQGFELKAGS